MIQVQRRAQPLRALFLSLTVPLLLAGCSGHSDKERSTSVLVHDPYAAVDWDGAIQCRANLHTHTAESDGWLAPATVIDEYHQRGYRILALTDHNRNTWPWSEFGRDPAELGMLAVPGNELSRHQHTGALFCELETEETDQNAALAEVEAMDGLAILFHPGRYWTPAEDGTVPATVVNHYTALFNQHDCLVGMEIINYGDRYPHDRSLWDALLAEMMPERPVHGFANDDMHRIATLGRDWTVYPLAEPGEEPVREAMRTGAFYAASISTHPLADRSVNGTPIIHRISHDERAATLTIEATVDGRPLGDECYHWLAGGEVLHNGPALSYRRHKRIDNYVRAEVVGTGGTAYTNAFGFARQ